MSTINKFMILIIFLYVITMVIIQVGVFNLNKTDYCEIVNQEVSKHINGSNYELSSMLKNVNFGLGDELDVCREKLIQCEINEFTKWFQLILIFVLAILYTKELWGKNDKTSSQ